MLHSCGWSRWDGWLCMSGGFWEWSDNRERGGREIERERERERDRKRERERETEREREREREERERGQIGKPQ